MIGVHKENKHIIAKSIRGNSFEHLEHVNEYLPWEKVQMARNKNRPTSRDFISKLSDSFYELKGDCVIGDNHTIIGGIATFQEIPFTVIGTQKGKGLLIEALFYNWGMASSSGYRKVLRLAKGAEKFVCSVLFFIDTVDARKCCLFNSFT